MLAVATMTSQRPGAIVRQAAPLSLAAILVLAVIAVVPQFPGCRGCWGYKG